MRAHDLAMLFVRDVWKLHGLPDSIVSDRGPLFVSEFWKAVCHRLQININLSTAYHPETDGQTENANSFIDNISASMSTLHRMIGMSGSHWPNSQPVMLLTVLLECPPFLRTLVTTHE